MILLVTISKSLFIFLLFVAFGMGFLACTCLNLWLVYKESKQQVAKEKKLRPMQSMEIIE